MSIHTVDDLPCPDNPTARCLSVPMLDLDFFSEYPLVIWGPEKIKIEYMILKIFKPYMHVNVLSHILVFFSVVSQLYSISDDERLYLRYQYV